MAHSLFIVVLATVTQSGSTASSWKPYDSPQGAYTVSLPGKPIEKKQTLALPGGVKIEMTIASSRRGNVTSYSVASGTLSAAPTAQKPILDAARDEIVKGLKGSLIKETSAEGAREFKVEIPTYIAPGGAVARVRIRLIENRLYEIIAVQTAADSKAGGADVDRFFLSFQPASQDGDNLRVEVDNSTGKGAASGQGTSAPAGDWEKFQSPGGKYTVLMLGKPTEKTEKGAMTLLGPTESRYAMVKRGPHYTLSVMYQDFVSGEFGKGDLEQIYDNAKKSLLTNVRGKLVHSKKVTLGDVVGRELKVELPRTKIPGGGIMQARYFFKGSRFYQVVYLAPKAEFNSDDAGKFLDSFQIEPK